jgi:hypothetical protein
LRLAVVSSVLVHGVVIAAALRIPAPERNTTGLVEFELRKREAPKLAPLTPPMPAPEPQKVASAPVEKRARPAEAAPEVKAVPMQPMETAPESKTPAESSQATVPERKGPIDLNLHGLPMSGEWAKPGAPPVVARPTGPPPDKAYKLRGDIGDPILGKLKEKKDDYPLDFLGARDGYVYNGPQFSAHINMDGTVSFDDKIVRDFKGLSGGFDITDWAMKGKKQDPYRYEKEKFLKATEKKRDELAKKAREAEMENSLAQLPWTCDEIWHQRYKTAAQRRKSLYELWRDVEENDAGARAREIIVAYIKRHLPADGPDAYTDEELAMYTGHGTHKFEPYR